MKPPEEVKVEFVRQWVTKAESDFNTAEHLSRSGESYVYAAAFHCREVSESSSCVASNRVQEDSRYSSASASCVKGQPGDHEGEGPFTSLKG